MIKLFREFIFRNSTGKKVLLLFIFANLVYVLMLTVTIPELVKHSNGMKIPDLMPSGYDLNYINTLFTTLGETGRNAYLFHQLPLDLIYPALFGAGYTLLFVYLLKKINLQNTPAFFICCLPVIAAISDYAENVGIITMLIEYPEITEDTVSTANFFTVLKSSATTLFFIALLIKLIVFGVNYLFKKRKGNSIY